MSRLLSSDLSLCPALWPVLSQREPPAVRRGRSSYPDDSYDDHDHDYYDDYETHLDPGHGAGGDDGEAVHQDGEQQEADLDTRIGQDKK